jgi:hypothetical protein
MQEISAQFDRMKGAEWFPFTHQKEILLLGQGGIGSWLSLLLARLGCDLTTYDMDSFETHNMSGQLVTTEYIGEPKVSAIKRIVLSFSPETKIYTNNIAYDKDSMTNEIVICGFDNMKARKEAFINWKDYVNSDGVGKDKCFFQDGRLLSEQLQIFNIPGDRPDLIEDYQANHLFDDSEVEEVECTFKQTSHCAAMIASHMVAFFTNWITKSHSGGFRALPYFYQYHIPLNRVDNGDKS